MADDPLAEEIGEKPHLGHPGDVAIAPTGPSAIERTGFLELLRIREFQLIWGSQIASQLADKFLVYSLLAVTYQRSAANTQEAVVLLAYTFPSVILSPIAGVYADRFDKRHLMMITNLIRGGLILLVPASTLIPYFQNVTWHLLLVTLLFSSVGQFFAPAEASSLPFIMPKRLLVTATSVFTLTIVATLVVGLPISSVLIRIFGGYAPYFVAAGLFGVAGLANYAMRTRLSAAVNRVKVSGETWWGTIWSELTETVFFLRDHPTLLRAFAQLGLAVMLIFSLFSLAQGYMDQVLHLAARDSYIILVPAAGGMGAVAFYLGRGHFPDRSRALTYGIVGMGVLLFLMGLGPYLLAAIHAGAFTLAFAAVVGALFGASFGLVFIPAVTLLQESTDPEQRGRTFGAMFTILNLAIAVPLFLAGLAADTFGLNVVLVLMGALLVGTRRVPITLRALHRLVASPPVES